MQVSKDRARGGADAPSVYDFTFDELALRVGESLAARTFAQLYKARELSRASRRALAAEGLVVERLSEQEAVAGSMTRKHVFGLDDGAAIESVRIRRRTGWTACVSSQVGCAMGCRFCASGRLGLKRHLRSGEIVEQVMALGRGINRVVFMGIGEPLHNYEQVLRAIRTLRDRNGLSLSTGGVTISSIGVPDGLRRLREEHLKVNLTISLHATTDALRHELIPGSKRYGVADVVELSQSWARRHNRRVTYVYLLLPGVNDSDADLERLADWFAGRPARVNLMRWNPVEGGDRFKRVDDRALSRFRRLLRAAGVPAVVRDTQGRDIDAACGQLWLRRQAASA